MKPRIFWAVTYVNCDDVMPDTIRRTRREAQEACCNGRYSFRPESAVWQYEWRQWRKRGCRAVKVEVRTPTGPQPHQQGEGK